MQQQVKSEIENELLKLMKIRQIPGLSMRLVRENKVIFDADLGFADLESKTSLTDKNLFRIGCLTKPVAALAILMLEREGKLSLTDAVQKYIPEIGNMPGNFDGKKITIAHLLSHSSGVARGDYSSEIISEEIKVSRIAKTPLCFAPGEQFKYSNWGYFLVGRIIAKASGMPPFAYLKKAILSPLKMSDTFMHEDFAGDLKDIATGYWKKWHFGDADLSQKSCVSPWYPLDDCSGGLISNGDDFAKFIAALNTGKNADGKIIFDVEIRERLFALRMPKTRSKFSCYGFFGQAYEDGNLIYFPASNSGFSAFLFCCPSEQIGGIAFANHLTCNNELKEMLGSTLDAFYPNENKCHLQRSKQTLTGTYLSHTGKSLSLFTDDNGNSTMEFEGERNALYPNTVKSYFQAGGSLRRNMLRTTKKNGMVNTVEIGSELFKNTDLHQNIERKFFIGWNSIVGIYNFAPFGNLEVLAREAQVYLNFGVIYECRLKHIEQTTFRQLSGPFRYEDITFQIDPENNQAVSFTLNGMLFKRIKDFDS